MHRPHRPFFGILGFLLILLAIGMYRVTTMPETYDFPLIREAQKTIEDITNSTGSMTATDFVEVTSTSSSGVLSKKIQIDVPFLVQAPLGNWDMPYQEACEEASLISVHHFLDGSAITPEQADTEILAMVEWENKEFNYSADVTVEELKQISEDYYHHRAQLFYEFTIEDMKRLLAAGSPIIVPLAGRDIGNPYYSGEGPWYHMLVVTGYDGNYFITNDVGTKRGHGYRYPQQRLFDSIHDWNMQKEDIRNGRRVMMVLEK